jgi:hypothetical protein
LLTSTQKLYFIVITGTAVLKSVHTSNPSCCAASCNNITWVLPGYFWGTNSTFGINWFKANFTWYLERKNAFKEKYNHVYLVLGKTISLFWRVEKSSNWSIIWDFLPPTKQNNFMKLVRGSSKRSQTNSYNLATLNSSWILFTMLFYVIFNFEEKYYSSLLAKL